MAEGARTAPEKPLGERDGADRPARPTDFAGTRHVGDVAALRDRGDGLSIKRPLLAPPRRSLASTLPRCTAKIAATSLFPMTTSARSLSRRAISPALLKSYRDSLMIRQRLVNSDPNNSGYQHDLSLSYNEVGDVRAQEISPGHCNRIATAWLSPRVSPNLIPAMPAGSATSLFPTNKVGDMHVAQGDLAGALKSYRDSLAIASASSSQTPAMPAVSATSPLL